MLRTTTKSTFQINPKLLEFELDERNQPTAEEHALCVTVLWGDVVVDAAVIKDYRDVVLGGRTADGVDVECELPNGPDRWLLARHAGDATTVVVPSMSQFGLRRGNGAKQIEANTEQCEISLGLQDRLAFTQGPITVLLQHVRGDAALGQGASTQLRFVRILSMTAIVHGYLVAAAHLTPNTNRGLLDELRTFDSRIASSLFVEKPEEPKKRLDLAGLKKAAPAKDESGRFGPKDKPVRDAQASRRGAPRVDPNKRERDHKIAMQSGLLGMFADTPAASTVLGPGGLGIGINEAMGGLRGAHDADAGGGGGLGSRGPGPGGGGDSLSIGSIGNRRGPGGDGEGNIDLGANGRRRIKLPTPGPTQLVGGLSKLEIQRVIRRNLPRFKYCYEKQLNKNPNLAGKVAINFTIAPTGSVAKARVGESTIDHRPVEDCVEKVLRSLKFPKPRGGGIVIVSYPFIFRST